MPKMKGDKGMSEEDKKEEVKVEVVEEKVVEEQNQPKKGFCIASLVLGIISVCIICQSWLSIICAILAIIFAVIGKNHSKNGMATAGLILGIIALALYAVIIIFAGTMMTGLMALSL